MTTATSQYEKYREFLIDELDPYIETLVQLRHKINEGMPLDDDDKDIYKLLKVGIQEFNNRTNPPTVFSNMNYIHDENDDETDDDYQRLEGLMGPDSSDDEREESNQESDQESEQERDQTDNRKEINGLIKNDDSEEISSTYELRVPEKQTLIKRNWTINKN
jgi:hypothetical protein